MWKKGQSGNPGGRRKKTADMRSAEELARQHTPDAIAALVASLKSDEGGVRVKAAEALLNRGWGQPSQTTHLTLKQDLREYTTDELTALLSQEPDSRAVGALEGEGESPGLH